MFVFSCFLILHMSFIVKRWGGPGGIEDLSSFSALTLLGHLTRKKTVPDMTYNVFGGTLNLTQPNGSV